MRTTGKLGAAAAAGVLTLALAGCGDDGGSGGSDDESEEFVELSVEEIRDVVLEDMRNAESFHLEGTFTEDGQEMSLDMGISADNDCAGSVTVEGGTAEIISGPDGTFLKGDQAFWDAATGGQGDQITAVLGDKWALVPEAQASSFSEICSLQNFIEELEEDEDEEGGAEKGETDEIDGQEALEIIGEDEDTGAPTHIWVATADPHYILQVSSDDEEEGGEISFSDYDEPVDTTPPDEDEYVDLSEVS